MSKSIEPNIAEIGNGWLKSYKLDYKIEQEPLNSEIDNALSEYFSKNGGKGVNRPDAKLLLRDSKLEYYPVIIEYKGLETKLEKLNIDGQVDNRKSNSEYNFVNINTYAVNGAVHYANAILHHTNYREIIAIGMTGHKNAQGKVEYKIGVYYVSESNFGIGQKVGEYTDFSFLKKTNFDDFIKEIESLKLSEEELDKMKEQREREIDTNLKKLNNDIYKNEKGLGENDRIYLVAASIMATIGVSNKVKPLEKSDLQSSVEIGNTDGDIIMRKIQAFLNEKNLPSDKKKLIIRTLENTITTENINKVENGESQLKRVFTKITDDLGIYYKIGLTTDFTGKLFNEMYSWLGFSQDKLNDVVLTPSYVANLLIKLAKVNKNSYVWDFATGSAGLLVSAMNEMLIDARKNIKSPDELLRKEVKIKSEQLLGLEILPQVYILAVLNMILMGDGSSAILNTNSLTEFDGNYGFKKTKEKFPADVFVLNPPYSAEGNGMVFVEKALSMMKTGYGAIIIQGSTGAGKATNFNKKILSQNTLIASIKMPIDLFVGKANVQTYIYVFKIGEKHNSKSIVKFIDFSNDGYLRSNRKKAKINLQDISNAKGRYAELIDLVHFGKSELNIFTENEYYEGKIDPDNGNDWNQIKPIDLIPTFNNYTNIVGNYLSWDIAQLIKVDNEKFTKEIDELIDDKLQEIKWKAFKIEDLFESSNGDVDIQKKHINNNGITVITSGITNDGILGKTDIKARVFEKDTITIDMFGNAYYRRFEYKMVTHARVFSLKLKKDIPLDKSGYFIIASISYLTKKYSYNEMCSWEKIKNDIIRLPIKNNEIDIKFMKEFISEIAIKKISKLEEYINSYKKIYNNKS